MKAVFFDRDGTVIKQKHYLHTPDDVELEAGAAAAIKQLREHGFASFIVTNQSGIGRGYFTEADYRRVEERVGQMLLAEGATVVDTAFCPCAPEANCECRKPKTGMVDTLAELYDIDLKSSWTVGDKASDVLLGVRMGGRGVLVLTGYGEDEREKLDGTPHAVTPTILDAAKHIVEHAND